MRQAVLDKKIHNFLARKEQQYPDLHRSVTDLTDDFVRQSRGASLIQVSQDSDDLVSGGSSSRTRLSSMRYAAL